jgi:hypothetical protein
MARIPKAPWNTTANRPILRGLSTSARDAAMFVRAVWRQRHLIDMPRHATVPSVKNTELLGVCAPDFRAMTRGLFDRRR